MSSETTNICGVLVHALPDRVPAVISSLEGLDGVEVHEVADAGRIVLTIEDTDRVTAFDQLTAVHRIPGVVAATLVYHHFEPAAAGTTHAA